MTKKLFRNTLLLSLLVLLAFACKKKDEADTWITPTFTRAKAEGDTIKLVLFSQFDWEIKTDADWTRPEVSSGKPIKPDTIKLFVDRNREREERRTSYFVSFKVEGYSDRVLTLIQYGVGNVISSETKELRETNTEVSKDIIISSNLDWDVTHSPSWLKVNSIDVTQSDPDKDYKEYKMNVTFAENTDIRYRTDSLVMTDNDGKGVSYSVSLYQDGVSNFKTDSLALLQLYKSTGGENWTNKWDLTTNVNKWYGVKCDSVVKSTGKEYRVVSLSLANNNIIGDIPSSFYDLIFLKLLWVNNNNLTATIGDEIGNFLELENLRLGNNPKLNGFLSPQISKCKNLVMLSIHHTELSGTLPETLADIVGLNFVELNDNQFAGVLPSKLGENRELKTLVLKNNNLGGVIPTTYLKNINWYDWDPVDNICPQRGSGFTNCGI